MGLGSAAGLGWGWARRMGSGLWPAKARLGWAGRGVGAREGAGVLRLEPDFLKWGSLATGN